MEWDIIVDKDDVVEPRQIECQDWECETILVIDDELVDDLAACYGWDPVTGWGQDTPQAIIDAGSLCDPNEEEQDCLIFEEYHPPGLDDETCPSGCAEGQYEDDAPAGCCLDQGEVEELVTELPEYDDLLVKVNDDCALGLEIEPTVACEPDGPAPYLADECPTSSIAATRDADFLVELDELACTLTVHTSAGEDTVPLSGLGAAAFTPNEFLAGIVDAEDTAVIGSTAFVDWRFWFTTAIEVDGGGGGSFTVPESQGYQIKGRGKIGSNWVNAVFSPSEDAEGVLNVGAGTFSLDYESTFTGGWVELHLEGDAYAAP